MNHLDRKMLNELKNGVAYQENLPVYTSQMLHTEYEYSMVLAALHYYTLGEVLSDDTDEVWEDVRQLAKRLQKTIHDGLIRPEFDGDLHEKTIYELDDIRNCIIHKMQILTAYTDVLQIYEYILNRIEAGILNLVEQVDIEKLSEELYRYIFDGKDNMVINSKLQMVTAQLPIRMTKAKFYDTVSQAFSIYNGSEKGNFDEFVERIRTTVLLDKPDGYETEYPKIYDTVEYLAGLDYQNMSSETLLAAQARLTEEANHITDCVTDYLMLTDVVNNVYAAVLAVPYANVISDALTNSQEIIRMVYEALEKQEAFEDALMGRLEALEGEQEKLIEELGSYEGIFYEVKDQAAAFSEAMLETRKLAILHNMQMLHSNSVFIDLKQEETDKTLVDTDIIAQAAQAFEKDMDALFAGKSRLVKRAYMAAVIGQLPVIFNNTKEIQEYIHYSLTNCSNDSELTAVKNLLEELMME